MAKKAFVKNVPQPQKHALAARDSIPRVDDRRPVWRFGCLDWEGPFSCRTIDAAAIERAVKRMAAMETMEWAEIEKGTKSHNISVGSLSAEARKRLEEIQQSDVDEVFSLRITGAERVFGIRDRWILRILWWDPEHRVCPSHKKHT